MYRRYRRKSSSPKRKKSIHMQVKKKSKKRGRPVEPYIDIHRLFITPKKTKPKKKSSRKIKKQLKTKSKKRKTTSLSRRSKSNSINSKYLTETSSLQNSNVLISPQMAEMLSVPMNYRVSNGWARLPRSVLRKLENKQVRKEVSRLEKGQLAGMKGFGKSKSNKSVKLSKHYTPRLQILQQEIQALRNELQHLKKLNSKSKSPQNIVPRRIQLQPVPRRVQLL